MSSNIRIAIGAGKTPASMMSIPVLPYANQSASGGKKRAHQLSSNAARKSVAVPAPRNVNKKKKHNPLREIKRWQKTFHCLLNHAPVRRFMKQVLFASNVNVDVRIQPNAVVCMMELLQSFMITHMGASNRCAKHGKRVTVLPKDLRLAFQILRDVFGDIYSDVGTDI